MSISFVSTSSSSQVNIWNSKAQTIVINTNANGEMTGIGAALMRYDQEVGAQYILLCAQGKVQVGVPVLFRSRKHVGKQYILCPIKQKSGDAPKAAALESCLRYININGGKWNVTSIATHKLGCGSSDVYLSWSSVYAMMWKWLSGVPVTVTVYGAKAPVVAPVASKPVAAVVVEQEPITSGVPSVPVTRENTPRSVQRARSMAEALFVEYGLDIPDDLEERHFEIGEKDWIL
jgi:hypothetical protein